METITNADYADDIVFLVDTRAQAKSLLDHLEQATRCISHYRKTEFIGVNQDGAIFSLNGKPLEWINLFIYISSNMSSSESDANICVM